MHIDVYEPKAAEQFWEGLRDVAAAATRLKDDELYEAIVKIGRAGLAQGVELVPSSGLFLRCPVCDGLPGQRCINMPRHPVSDNALHPERIDLAKKALAGEVPLPAPLR
ncbi:hypothetical protein O7632_26670 [Solwaraspora sp. WMMD406]|uniref:zinc finger domain-containing protein n=1 Tax=Solwaraspora sp. WMMD406 TaxID=3016095 RepID=UPI0024177766|nr:hypothetical protein [Solwaraspora sp. WMMD406]MDG4767649.1 hypothetical protein [Solwaraspora sp. WMMD406]